MIIIINMIIKEVNVYLFLSILLEYDSKEAA
jgi:hypothetical protein